jgi:hypothetical protein
MRRLPAGEASVAASIGDSLAAAGAPLTWSREAILAAVLANLDRIYRLELAVNIEEFLINRETCDRLTGESAGAGAVLVQEGAGGIRLGLFIAEDTWFDLSRQDPTARLTSDNLGSFCTLTEEVSHFAYLLWNAEQGRPITQLELELQAEVDKFITATLLWARQNRGLVSQDLLGRLFGHYDLREGLDAGRRARYHAASALARTYCQALTQHFIRGSRLKEMLAELRRFYRLSQPGKIAQIHATAFG